MTSCKNVMLVAGEASGDIAAAQLINATKAINQDVNFFGIGGDLSEKAGLESIFPYENLGVMGITAVVKNYKTIKQALDVCTNNLDIRNPDLLILVDYPGFNLRLAKIAKNRGIKVLYFISPKVWAWNKKRIHILKKNVDHMAVIFPFEVKIYEDIGLPVTHVTHPSLLQAQSSRSRAQTCSLYELDPDKTIVCLMPGSRKAEIKLHMPLFQQLINTMGDNYQFVIPLADTIKKPELQHYLDCQYQDRVIIIAKDQYNIISASDEVIVASGTAALEVALLCKPMCVIYKLSWLSYMFAKLVLRLPYISLPNIIAGKEIIPELLQHKANVNTLKDYLNSSHQDTIMQLKQMREELDSSNTKDIGSCVISLLT